MHTPCYVDSWFALFGVCFKVQMTWSNILPLVLRLVLFPFNFTRDNMMVKFMIWHNENCFSVTLKLVKLRSGD